jgi:cyclase
MLKTRVIPVLFLKRGFLVRSELFTTHQNLGNPTTQVSRFNTWNVDELIYIDITPDGIYDIQRDDLGGAGFSNPNNFLDIVKLVATQCFMPLTVGGKIRTLEDARLRLRLGADKITLNTAALANPGLITTCAEEFGSQAVVLSIDVRRHDDGRYEVFSDLGARARGRDPVAWCREGQDRGAGEILLNAIHRDGVATGYDIALLKSVVDAVEIPVIALGGVGDYEHLAQGVTEGGAQAVAAGNIFNFKEHSYPLAKRYLRQRGIDVR